MRVTVQNDVLAIGHSVIRIPHVATLAVGSRREPWAGSPRLNGMGGWGLPYRLAQMDHVTGGDHDGFALDFQTQPGLVIDAGGGPHEFFAAGQVRAHA